MLSTSLFVSRANNVFVTFIFCVVGLLITISAGAQNINPNEPIAFIGHGALFGPDGAEIAPTAKFMKYATEWYIRELSGSLTSSEQSEFDSLQKLSVQGASLDEQSILLVNTRLIDWLLDRSKRKDVDGLRGKNKLLKNILRAKLTDHSDVRFPRGVEKFHADPNLLKIFDAIRKATNTVVPFGLTTNSGEAYRAECAAAGVPIPPNFGPGTGWISQGIIPRSDLFIARGDDAEVLTWSSQSPEGMCIALPRYNLDKTVEADGIICVGKATSNVCFWDNQVRDAEGDDSTFKFMLGSEQPFSKWAGGSDLRGGVGGICSDCHAGENPYIIHGKVLFPLSEKLPTFPANWYNPIVRSGDTSPWPENPGPSDAPKSCQGCHGSAATPGDAGRLPMLSSRIQGYCNAVLRSSIGALAPPLPGKVNAPPSMPQGKRAGTLACTPGLPPADPRYRRCSTDTTFDCTPIFSDSDLRRAEPDFPDAYQISCTKEMSEMLNLCKTPG